ncbi:hypothetical protein MCUN1_003637 [Malassezia cuniculi]|uniref:Uncharacterized protein n=1 Tax=Malassezia cuniculi TaxID=948313 RepID=A0AAF0J857_9BASI|nr:hypothetical protein MCUN1_003637 [Malassezia cuniculi]
MLTSNEPVHAESSNYRTENGAGRGSAAAPSSAEHDNAVVAVEETQATAETPVTQAAARVEGEDGGLQVGEAEGEGGEEETEAGREARQEGESENETEEGEASGATHSAQPESSHQTLLCAQAPRSDHAPDNQGKSLLKGNPRFYGKPLPSLIGSNKARTGLPRNTPQGAPISGTSRPAGLQRTVRIPPLHPNRKSPPPKRPKFESKSKKKDASESDGSGSGNGSDAEYTEDVPVYDDVEDAGFL